VTRFITRREALEQLATVAAVPVGLAGVGAAGQTVSAAHDSTSPRTGVPVIIGSVPLAVSTRGAEAVSEQLGALEHQIKQQIEYFPQPLKDLVEPLKQRIPPPAAAAQFGGGERLQNIVGIMQQAARVSQRTGFFHLGELVECGETQQIFTNPKDERTQGYITGRFG